MVAATPNGRNAPPRIAGRHARPPAERLARRLGWFSVALGVPQVVAPARMNELAGIDDTPRNRAVMRAIGLREIGGGAGILARRRPGGLLLLRVAGDVADLLLLRAALRARGSVPSRIAAAAAGVAGVAVLDAIASAKNASRDPGVEGNAIRARSSITINRSPDDVYGFWRDIENLPSFMYHLEAVQRHDETRSHWIAKGPAGLRVEWDAEIVEDVPGERIAWWSLAGSDVRSTGSVTFRRAPAEQGTEVTVDLQYAPPAGAIGAAVARLFGEEPTQQVKDDLRRLKQVMETGEVVRSVSTPEGTRTARRFLQRSAQPRD